MSGPVAVLVLFLVAASASASLTRGVSTRSIVRTLKLCACLAKTKLWLRNSACYHLSRLLAGRLLDCQPKITVLIRDSTTILPFLIKRLLYGRASAAHLPPIGLNKKHQKWRFDTTVIRSRNQQICSLINNMHPVFLRPGIQNKQHRGYLILFEPAFRLASNLLSADFMLPFWYTVLVADTEPMQPAVPQPHDDREKQHYVLQAARKELSAKQKQSARKALANLHHFLSYEMESCKYSGWTASCSPSSIVIEASPDTTETRLLKGESSTIHISTNFYETLSDPSITLQDYALLQLLLARQLLHELAHAAKAARRSRGHYYYWPGVPVSEDGYQMEQFLFGGILKVHTLELSQVLSERQDGTALTQSYVRVDIEEWPNQGIVNHYREKGWTIAVADEVKGDRYCLPVSFDWVKDLLSERYWQQQVFMNGLMALRPKALRELHAERRKPQQSVPASIVGGTKACHKKRKNKGKTEKERKRKEKEDKMQDERRKYGFSLRADVDRRLPEWFSGWFRAITE